MMAYSKIIDACTLNCLTPNSRWNDRRGPSITKDLCEDVSESSIATFLLEYHTVKDVYELSITKFLIEH